MSKEKLWKRKNVLFAGGSFRTGSSPSPEARYAVDALTAIKDTVAVVVIAE